MGNCCIKTSKGPKVPLYGGSVNDLDYFARQKQMLKEFMVILEHLKEIKNFKKIWIKKEAKKRTNDDNRLGKTRNIKQLVKRVQSMRLNKNAVEIAKIQSRNQKMKMLERKALNLWDNIDLESVKVPEKKDIRSRDLKHIIRKDFDMIHWNVILRIFQIHDPEYRKIKFMFFVDKIKKEYDNKYNLLFDKKNIQGRQREERDRISDES